MTASERIREARARVGATWTIRAPKHAGHTLTVTSPDPVEKHHAWRVTCSCGHVFYIGSAHIDRCIAEGWSPYDSEDARS